MARRIAVCLAGPNEAAVPKNKALGQPHLFGLKSGLGAVGTPNFPGCSSRDFFTVPSARTVCWQSLDGWRRFEMRDRISRSRSERGSIRGSLYGCEGAAVCWLAARIRLLPLPATKVDQTVMNLARQAVARLVVADSSTCAAFSRNRRFGFGLIRRGLALARAICVKTTTKTMARTTPADPTPRDSPGATSIRDH